MIALPPIERTASGCSFAVRVSPGARKDEITGVHDGALKLKIAAPPVEGEANKALVRFLARKVLGLSRSQVEIVSGAQSRDKRVAVEASVEQVEAALRVALAEIGA